MVQATEKYYLEQIRVLELELEKVQKELVLGLNSLEEKVRELELEKGKALVRVTELEMALDFERAKMMGQG
jgi:hypothetical protein